MILINCCSLQKPILCSIRSFGSSTTRATTRTVTTALFATKRKNAGHIKRTLFRYPTSHRCFSAVNISEDHHIVRRGGDGHDGEEFHYYQNEQFEENKFMKGPNPGLASVVSQGIKSLEQTAEEIQYKTRNASLSKAHKKPSFRNGRAAEMDPRQLAEGQRILDVASDCLEKLALQEQSGRKNSDGRGSNGLVLFGEPIVLLECEVNRNVRQAKIYWTLPYGILLDNRINQRLYQEIMVKVQKQLVENGGAKLLARNVHTRLSYYYPPRIKLFPATDEMVQTAIEEFMV